MDNPTYLGDGVYASFDGCNMIWLDLRGQDDTTRIALEPEVFAELLTFVKTCGKGWQHIIRCSARELQT